MKTITKHINSLKQKSQTITLSPMPNLDDREKNYLVAMKDSYNRQYFFV